MPLTNSLANVVIKDEGVNLSNAISSMNFTGAGVTATNAGSAITVNVPGGGGAAIPVKDEGVQITAGVTSFNFTGAGVTATAVGNDVTVNVPSGGGAGIISANTTLNVPASYATIDAAMSYLRAFIIDNGVTVTIKVADGTYNIVQPFNLFHRDGEQIQIIGNTVTPANCIISFTGIGAFVCNGSSSTVGLIDGFKVTSTHWTSHGVWNATGGSAFAATFGSTLNIGHNVLIDKCYYGVRASEGGQIFVDSNGITVTEAGDGGFFAFLGGSIQCIGSTSNSASDSANGLGFGFISETGGSIRADNAHASSNAVSGFFANTGAAMWANGSTSSNNSRHGYEIERASSAEIRNATASNNTVFGMYVANNSYVLKTGLAGTGNGSGLTGFGTNGILG